MTAMPSIDPALPWTEQIDRAGLRAWVSTPMTNG